MPTTLALTCLVAAFSFAAADENGINLYTGADDGNVTSLRLSMSGEGYTLEQTSVSGSCGSQPVWLDLDKPNNLLYCLDRPGSITTFGTSENGELSTPLATGNTTSGPVSSAFYNKGEKRGLAASHYTGGAVTAWNASPGGDLELIQTLSYPPPDPVGPKPAQNVSHCHDVIVDFTGTYLVVPDLGYDLLRVYTFDADNNSLTEISTVPTTRGAGPRHGLFWSPDADWLENRSTSPLYFYVLAELDVSIISWRVTYPEGGGLHFDEIEAISSHPGTTNTDVIPAEIELSPDNRFIYTTNRNDSYYNIPALNPGNKGGTEVSDSLSVFAPREDGTLEFLRYQPAGGLWPRHIKFNKAGDLAAVSLQHSHRVAIIQRDVETGVLSDFVAHVDAVGQAVVTVWDD